MKPTALLMTLRPKQWTKNLLLFAGFAFAGDWGNALLQRNAVAGFLVFCLLSGFVYIVNDIADVEKDRQHPKKKKRPIAAGDIPVPVAMIWGLIVLGAALGYAWMELPRPFFVFSVVYVLLITAYSFLLKHMVVLDILTLAMGFVIRAIAGVEVLRVADKKIEITSFFVLTTLFLALFLAICKRRNELTSLGAGAADHRKVLSEYSTEFLDSLLAVATTCVIFSYALWTTQGQFVKASAAGHTSQTYVLVLTIPFVLYGIFRYIWLVLHQDEGGAPESLLVKDVPLLATVVLWLGTTLAILFLMK